MPLIALPAVGDWSLDSGLETVRGMGIRLARNVSSSLGTLISSFATSVFDAGAIVPTGISATSDGTLWVCDAATLKIYNIQTDGTLISSFAASVFDVLAINIQGISVDPDGTLWVWDRNSVKIYVIQRNGTLISSFATSVFDAGATIPTGVSVDPDGTLWVCDAAFSTKKIYNIQRNGTLITSFATSVYDAGATEPQGVSAAPDGTLWVCDNGTDKVYNIETDGTLITSFATSVYDAGATGPIGISATSDGTLWVCDAATDKVYNIEGYKYSTTSPVAESPWIAIDQNTLDATTPISIQENDIATLLGQSTGSIKYQYALNNGAFNGSWLTQAALITALQSQAITDHTNSLKIKAQMISDGTQAADIVIASFVQASGGRGGIPRGRIINA